MNIVERLRAKASIYISDDFDEAADTIEEMVYVLREAAKYADRNTFEMIHEALRRVEEKR